MKNECSLLRGDKVRLRAPEPSDAFFLYSLDNDTLVWDNTDTVAPPSLELICRSIQNYTADPWIQQGLQLMIEAETDGIQGILPVGVVELYDISRLHLHAKVGIQIDSEYRRMGFARDALLLIARYASRRLGLKSLGAVINFDNIPSRCLFENCGYTMCGTLPDWLRISSGFTDACIYTISLS